MTMHARMRTLALTAASLMTAGAAWAADDDALSLQVPTEAAAPADAAPSALKLVLEAGAGRLQRRYGLGDQDVRRLAIDVRFSARISDAWRWAVSDRLESLNPPAEGQRETQNLLREAYLSWQGSGPVSSMDIGRVNVRTGVALGYSPSDFFRVGANKSAATLDPIAVRENRLGTAMLRVAHLSGDYGMSLSLAPKIESRSSGSAFSPDWAATNSRDRALWTASFTPSQRVSLQLLALAESGRSATLGLNGTALLGDALVGYLEWTSAKRPSLLAELQGLTTDERRRSQLSLGGTYSLPTKTSLTMEAEYNGRGLTRADWFTAFGLGLAAYGQLVTQGVSDQSLVSRKAVLVHVSQKEFLTRQLELSGFVRRSGDDHSHIAWLDLRYHLNKVDLALQWQRASGNAATEFGGLPQRQQVQLIGVWFL